MSSKRPVALHDRWRLLWPNWYEIVPEVVLVTGLTVFLVDETNAATSSLSSLKAVALIIGTAIAWIAARLLVARVVPWAIGRLAVFTVIAIGILAVVVLPAYDDNKVVEAFPGLKVTAGGPDRTETTESRQDAQAAPVVIRSSTLHGIDHRASGTVNLYRQPNNRYVVGLESIDVQPGPDYDLYVVPGEVREDRDGAVHLGDLRGNQGTQFYEVPSDVPLEDGPWTVLIWCQTFAVPIANSTPSAV